MTDTNGVIQPIYIAQTGEIKHYTEGRKWFAEQQAIAAKEGCTLFRYSVDDIENPSLWLIEGWLNPVTDQGEPRFSLAPLEKNHNPNPSYEG